MINLKETPFLLKNMSNIVTCNSSLLNPFVDLNDLTLQQGQTFNLTHHNNMTEYLVPQSIHCSEPQLTCQAIFKDHVDMSTWSAQTFNVKIKAQEREVEVNDELTFIHINEFVLENVRAPQFHDFDPSLYVSCPVDIDSLSCFDGSHIMATIELVANGAGTYVEITFPLPSRSYSYVEAD